ncbi:MAG: PDZ domain-containing protein [Candidatus Latescibacteria bacterium]|nr:PDZ domain-containing protein [Candidatus Latescibacterota bacterium]
MSLAIRLFLCTLPLLGIRPALAASPLLEEFRQVLSRTAVAVDRYYRVETNPDSLMYAGMRGFFRALDPSSEYTLTGGAHNLQANLHTLFNVAQTVQDSAQYNVSDEEFIRAGVRGMMSILDPYSLLLEKRHLDNFNIETKGEYGGLGFHIRLIYPDSAIAVASLLNEKTPAALAGVRSGDIIIAIDDSSTQQMSVGDAADLMRGRPGTPVTLTLERAGYEDPFEISIVRQKVELNSVTYYTLFPDSTGYVKLDKFMQDCSKEVRRAIEDLQDQGLKRLIFDLRNNEGGLLPESVAIANLFLPQDRMVVYHAGRAYPDTTRFFTEERPLLDDEPLIVLVNERSASASEIVAGAIQDWDRGLVMGDTTWGKGSVQTIIPLSDTAELKLTIAAYYTPSGRSIDRHMRKDSTLVSDPSHIYRTLQRQRIVRGGGGITPDIQMEGRRGSSLFAQLRGWTTQDSKFFRFSRQYHVGHPDITPQFRADAQTVEQFHGLVHNSDFNYISTAEARLQDLVELAEEEEEFADLTPAIETLKGQIDQHEKQHWTDNKDLIQWQLTYDILEKNFGLKAAYAYDATVDPVLLEARAIIADRAVYTDWFNKTEIGVAEEQAIAGMP